MSRKTALYKIVEGDEVLYVGITTNPATRFQNHRVAGIAPRGSELVVVRWYADRTAALRAEHRLMMKLRPPFNVAGLQFSRRADIARIKEAQLLREYQNPGKHFSPKSHALRPSTAQTSS